MNRVRIQKHCTTLIFQVPKKSFFGIFRYGSSVLAEVKVCCDDTGKISWFVIDGPKDIDYKNKFKKKFKEAEELVTQLWNDGRRQQMDYKTRLKEIEKRLASSKPTKPITESRIMKRKLS